MDYERDTLSVDATELIFFRLCKHAWLTALIVIGTNYVALAGEFKPFEGPKRIAVLIESNPWRMVMGSDTPRCIVYENREVLFLKKEGCYQHKLSDQEFTAFTTRLSTLTRLPNPKRFYDLCPNVTDPGDTYVYVALGGRHIATQVYGSMPGDPESPHDPDCDEKARQASREFGAALFVSPFDRLFAKPALATKIHRSYGLAQRVCTLATDYLAQGMAIPRF